MIAEAMITLGACFAGGLALTLITERHNRRKDELAEHIEPLMEMCDAPRRFHGGSEALLYRASEASADDPAERVSFGATAGMIEGQEKLGLREVQSVG